MAAITPCATYLGNVTLQSLTFPAETTTHVINTGFLEVVSGNLVFEGFSGPDADLYIQAPRLQEVNGTLAFKEVAPQTQLDLSLLLFVGDFNMSNVNAASLFLVVSGVSSNFDVLGSDTLSHCELHGLRTVGRDMNVTGSFTTSVPEDRNA